MSPESYGLRRVWWLVPLALVLGIFCSFGTQGNDLSGTIASTVSTETSVSARPSTGGHQGSEQATPPSESAANQVGCPAAERSNAFGTLPFVLSIVSSISADDVVSLAAHSLAQKPRQRFSHPLARAPPARSSC